MRVLGEHPAWVSTPVHIETAKQFTHDRLHAQKGDRQIRVQWRVLSPDEALPEIERIASHQAKLGNLADVAAYEFILDRCAAGEGLVVLAEAVER